MKRFLSAAVIVLVIALTGCKSTLHQGGNWVRGEAEGFNFLGFMTFFPVTYSDALIDLYKNANIKDPNEYMLINFNAETNANYFVLFSLPKVTVEAEKIYIGNKKCKLVCNNVTGQSTGFKFLGFMTFVPTSYSGAISDLYKNAKIPLHDAKYTYTDVFIESYDMYFILFSIPKLKIRADIVELTPLGKPAKK